MVEVLLEGLRRRDRRALSRLLTLAARGQHLAEIEAGLARLPRGTGRVVAFTGAGGVGKSTLIGKLLERAHARGRSVAVLACDPQSPLTGGALLGDRFRMGAQTDDAVFIRSLATPGGSHAVAPRLPLLIRLLRAYGFDLIFLETVGAGQGDTAVSRLADLVVLLLQPESGDELQWEKAGLLEVADVIVVHKADLPGADRTLAQVRSMLDLAHGKGVAVLTASSGRNQGVDELDALIAAAASRREPDADPLDVLREEFERRLEHFAAQPAFAELVRRWREAPGDAVQRAGLWEAFAREESLPGRREW